VLRVLRTDNNAERTGAEQPAGSPAPSLPRISLIVATVDRVRPLQSLLSSLVAQDYQNLEILIADQNAGDVLAPVMRMFEKRLDLKWLRTQRGLSRARNAALRHSTGEIVGFPDDDCIYPLGLLHTLVREFAKDLTLHGICIAPVDETSGKRFRGFKGSRTTVTARNTWSLTCSVGLFLRSNLIEEVGGFDETLGLGGGTPWLASEDRDYPLRALEKGFRLAYEPGLGVLHPTPKHDLSRAFSYGASCGRVLRKHSAGPFEILRMVVVRPIGAAVLSTARGDWASARYYTKSFFGRVRGWISSGA